MMIALKWRVKNPRKTEDEWREPERQIRNRITYFIKQSKGMRMRFFFNAPPFLFLISIFSLVLFSSSVFCTLGFCNEEEGDLKMSGVLGGVRDSPAGAENSVEIDSLARFAVDEHNKKENALLEFARVLKAKEQTVAGSLHHLTLEVIDAGKKKIYEAKVWVKPWMNFKELQEFKHAGDDATPAAACTPSDLGVKQDGHAPGWRDVPADDPVVKDAADHAVKTIQQRSNSLSPYELLEILLAKAEVIEDTAKFNLLLKLKRGSKEEKFKVEVHKNVEGTYRLNQMEQHHD